MRDEFTQLLDAWGRREAAGADAGLPPLRPSAGFLAAARRARLRRLALRASLAVAFAALVIMLIVMFARRPEARPTSTAPATPAAEE